MRCQYIFTNGMKREIHTLMARVQMVAMTSKDPPRTWFTGNLGSYSHMAVVVSTAAILVMWDIMSMLVRFTTCPRHLCHEI